MASPFPQTQPARLPRPWPAVIVSRATLDALCLRLLAPVDIASIVVFRIAFGAIMLWEVYRYFDHGWIPSYYIDPIYNFPYVGFEWVKPWPGIGMYLHFYALGALAICIVLGLWYRVAAGLFFLGFTYVFLLEKAHYLNHFYFISLMSFLLIFVPAHRACSLDAVRNPTLRSDTVPTWALVLLAGQLSVVYVFGGLAKLNGDWLRGEPMRMWLADRPDFPLIGRWFTEEWMVYSFSYGGLLFDLLIVPLLLWKRTRLVAFLAALAFHVVNDNLFQIGVFPWFALAATVLFFPPDLPRRALARLRPSSASRARLERPAATTTREPSTSPGPRQYVTIAFVALYMTIQLAVPLRHHLYPGNVAWTEEGHRFSWRMKLRTKSGTIRFIVTDPSTGSSVKVKPREYLTRRQARKMATQPDMILQFSHFLAARFEQDGWKDVQVRAISLVSLNGREPQPMIDPNVDLARVRTSILPASWILPLTTDLPIASGPASPSDEE